MPVTVAFVLWKLSSIWHVIAWAHGTHHLLQLKGIRFLFLLNISNKLKLIRFNIMEKTQISGFGLCQSNIYHTSIWSAGNICRGGVVRWMDDCMSVATRGDFSPTFQFWTGRHTRHFFRSYSSTLDVVKHDCVALIFGIANHSLLRRRVLHASNLITFPPHLVLSFHRRLMRYPRVPNSKIPNILLCWPSFPD